MKAVILHILFIIVVHKMNWINNLMNKKHQILLHLWT